MLRGGEFVFTAYNVANYGPVLEPGRKKPAKSAKATEALIAILREINADIIGVCEMGSPVQFEDFRQRLATAGLGYTAFEYVEGADPARRLALVSRFPIIARQSRPDVAFDANGSYEQIRRGILDVTIETPNGFRMRLIGVHFKSKLAAREDEALIRRHEAHLLRQHLDAIIAAEPEMPVLLYGDFNDTRESTNIREIGGLSGTPGVMTPLPLEDALGDRWTHYWKAADLYSRIDYLFLNRAAARAVLRKACYIHRSPDGLVASDHRPLVARFRTLLPSTPKP